MYVCKVCLYKLYVCKKYVSKYLRYFFFSAKHINSFFHFNLCNSFETSDKKLCLELVTNGTVEFLSKQNCKTIQSSNKAKKNRK